MPTFDDLIDTNQGTGNSKSKIGAALSPAARKLPVASFQPKTVNPNIDAAWGGTSIPFAATGTNPYYQYYYSGQDIIVSIDGTEGNTDFQNLPILSLGWNITQSKLMIYGFWSYTADAIARGARQITGSFSLATKSPNYMTKLLAQVATSRLNQTTQYSNTNISQDDQNILQFWSGQGGTNTMQTGSTVNLYQEHPPFDMVLIYGVQDVSLTNMNNVVTSHAQSNPWYVDTNERLVDSVTTDQSNRIVLKSCEILGMSTSYTPSGDIIQETYNFVAFDAVNAQNLEDPPPPTPTAVIGPGSPEGNGLSATTLKNT